MIRAWCSQRCAVATPQPRNSLHPRNILRTLHAILAAANMPRLRFHDLRHSGASLLIAEGVQLAEVSMLLGHSELRITADLYKHVVKQTSSKAAQHMDAMLQRRERVS